MQIMGSTVVKVPTLACYAIQTKGVSSLRQNQIIRFGGERISTQQYRPVRDKLEWSAFYFRIYFSGLLGSLITNPNHIEAVQRYSLFQRHKKLSVDNIGLKELRERTQSQPFFDVYFRSGGANGPRLNGWYFPAPVGSAKPTIIIAHGNSGNMHRIEDIMLAFLKRGYGVFAFDYRGYGRSEGIPSEKGTVEDFDAASRFLNEFKDPKYRVPYDQQRPLGYSMGGAVVLEALGKQAQAGKLPPYNGVVLVSTFTSLPEIWNHMKQKAGISSERLKVEDKMIYRYESIQHIKHLRNIRLFFVHGSNDSEVPHYMSHALAEQAVGIPDRLKTVLTISGGLHEGLFSQQEIADHIIDAMEAQLNENSKVESTYNETVLSKH